MYCRLVKARELMRRLEEAGWSLLRVRGSHHIYGKKGHTFSVPYHASKDLKKGLVIRAIKTIEEVG
jgi:predicted RNA binding protein YcfA (HicA-like mRNA interferase family)